MLVFDNEVVSPDAENTELDKSLALLGKIWNKLLKHTDEEVDIDPEYTRLGIGTVLEMFSNKIEECDFVHGSFEYTD